jgi:hypothetical protein
MGLCAFFTAASERGNIRGISIWLPGTQPGQADTAASRETCRACHAQAVKEWAGSMEAHSVRDPIFNAYLSITTKYSEPMGLDVGEYCLRCHAPSAWLAGRSHPGTVKFMRGSDLDGVNCDFCHRSLDPLHPDSSAIVGGIVPGYGNGMYVVQKATLPVRNARGVVEQCGPTVVDPFYRKSEYCGVCHELSNPYLSSDPKHTTPYLQHPITRSFSEWELSYFATRGEAGTCQSCHMKRLPGYATSFPPFRYRLDVASHDLAGGNTFAPRAIMNQWNDVDKNSLLEGIERSKAILKTALKLEVQAGKTQDSVVALVRITNLTGHKLPTGTPEARQLWISVTGRNNEGQVVFQSGTYDSTTKQFLRDPQSKVYEAVMGMTPQQAEKVGKAPGPSFFRAFNDTVLFDNRIPPRGFSNEAFRERKCAPTGYRYSDGQYWDVSTYSMSGDVASISVSVLYQVASKEFIEFLKDENIGNPYDWNEWGQKVYDAWQAFGDPELIAQATVSVAEYPPELQPFQEPKSLLELRLTQNYPNPFNGTSTAEFWISEPARTTVRLYNIAGQEVQRLLDEEISAGIHSVTFSSSELASGMYLYRVTAQGYSLTKKLLVIR